MFRPSLYLLSYLTNCCCGCGGSSCSSGCAGSIEAAYAFCLANWPEEEVFCDCAVACSCKISITLEKSQNAYFKTMPKKVLFIYQFICLYLKC